MNFTPAIYEHAAKVIGKTPWDVSRDSELIVQAHVEAYNVYQHTPVVVGIDVYNLEAEAYGAVIDEPEGTDIPAISTHAFSGMTDILELELLNPSADGRLPMVIAATKQVAEQLPGVDVRVPISGPFSILSNLVGFDTLLMDAFTTPETVIQALNHIVDGQIKFCNACAEQGLTITMFESSATPPLISPAIFKDVVLPPLQRLTQQATQVTGAPVSCIIGGDTAPILQSLLETGAKYVICPFETDQARFMELIKSYSDVMVRINMDARVFTLDDNKQLFAEADRVMALAKERELVCIGTGVLPYEARPEAVFAVRDYMAKKS